MSIASCLRVTFSYLFSLGLVVLRWSYSELIWNYILSSLDDEFSPLVCLIRHFNVVPLFKLNCKPLKIASSVNFLQLVKIDRHEGDLQLRSGKAKVGLGFKAHACCKKSISRVINMSICIVKNWTFNNNVVFSDSASAIIVLFFAS